MKIITRTLVLLLSYTLLSVSLPAAAQAPRPGAGGPVAQQLDFVAALRQGRTLLKRGKADLALPLLETALRLATEANHPREMAAAHDTLGDLYSRQGQYETALTHYQQAREGFQAAATQEAPLKRVVGIGDSAYNSDLMLAKVGDTNIRMGQLEAAAGNFNQMQVQKPDTSALGQVNQAKKSFGAFGRLKNIATGQPSLSTATEAVGAVNAIQQTFELYRQSILYATHELGLGRVDFQTERLDSAKKHFENALAALGSTLPGIGNLGQTRRFRTVARTSLGDVALKQVRAKDAVKAYTDALNGAKADQRLDLTWPAQRGIGRAKLLAADAERDPQRKLKAMDDALISYRDALQTIETIRQGSVRADEARTTFLATTENVYDEAASALAAMALLAAAGKSDAPLEGPALNYAAEAFKITEQGRARSLLDMLSEARAEITGGVPPELLQQKRTNLERQQEIAEQLTGVSPTGQAPDKAVTDLEAELEQLETAYESLENQIRAANPRYASLTGAQPLALADVQQQVLDDNTVLLEYSLGADRSYLWAVTNKTVSLYQLPPRAALDKQASDLRDQIVPTSARRSLVELSRGMSDERGIGVSNSATATGNAAQFVTAAHALYQATLAPAAKVFGAKRLLVVADGALNYVPFEALVSAPGGTDFAALPYLVLTNEFIYAPSASVVASIRQQKSGAPSAGRGLLVIADPVFDASDPRAKNPAASGAQDVSIASAVADVAGAPAATGKFRLARLTGTRAEAQQIAQLARTAGLAPDVWLDLDANEANVKTRDIGNYRVLHVATHGLLNTERPQFTGVVLSLVGNREGDGFLRTDEIFNLKLGAPLVMLSACETGLGKEKRGEGVIGLTRAFMYAGAPAVGVSLWSVSDRSTADLMTDFYKRYLGKQPLTPSAALRAAQQQMIAGKRNAAPFFWAPFVLVGDWK